ncbi:MAG TPA: TolC family protein [Candidatus Omnitrophota bacterium]|nr:TolC family protein [Candidatus Omnitrophota bacterium]
MKDIKIACLILLIGGGAIFCLPNFTALHAESLKSEDSTADFESAVRKRYLERKQSVTQEASLPAEQEASAVVPEEIPAEKPVPAFDAVQDSPAVVAGDETPSLVVDDKTALTDKVHRLRREEKEKFQELTDGFIKKIITEETVMAKEQFLSGGPRNLDECVRRAIDTSVSAKMAKERVKLAKQRIIKALRDLFSSVNLELETRHGSLSTQAFTGNSYHVQFKQPVFHGGSLWHTYQKEDATLHSAEAEYNKVTEDLVQKVSEAYFDSLRAAQVLEDKREILKLADEIFGMNKQKWAQGLISEIEYLNVESRQSQIAHDVEKAKEDYELVFLELQKHLNLALNERIDLTSFYDYDEVMNQAREHAEEERKGETGAPSKDAVDVEQPVEHYLQMAYDHRPDLKQEVNRLRANIMAKRVAVGKLLPQADLVMKFGELGESYTDIVKHPAHNPEWECGVELTWNLGGSTMKYNYDHDQKAPSVSQYQGGEGTTTTKNSFTVALLDNLEDVYRVKEAEIEILDQFVKLEETEREMIREVKEAYFNFRRAEIQLSSEIKQILYRERLAKLSKHKLDIHEIEASEYLQSELELVDEKEKFHKAMSDYYVARAGLNRAVGVQGLLPIEKWKEEK